LVIADGEHHAIAEFGIDGGGFWLEGRAVRCSLFVVRIRNMNFIVILSGAKGLLLLTADC
jgi:hypothetical protein